MMGASGAAQNDDVGIVVIGRNEGERLVRCLRSVQPWVARTVYVDSGSTDGSVEVARRAGVHVVRLDPSMPFTAARGRNEGLTALRELHPEVRFVQLLDGDCELEQGWIEAGGAELRRHADAAAVAGRLRERAPEASLYNLLADMEWGTLAVGETPTCGGVAMWRVDTLRTLRGFDPTLIAGEESDLCRRARGLGQHIRGIDHTMAWHDMDMHHFSQWWLRRVRSGHAYAELAWRQGRSVEPRLLRRAGSIVVWGGALPAVGVLGAVPTLGLSFVPWLGYSVLWARSYRDRRRRGDARGHAGLYATACIAGKVPDFVGLTQFMWNRVVRRRATEIIEHKTAGATGG